MAEKTITVNEEITERIKLLLEKYGSTQRWFVTKLVEAGLEMTDTKLSNRMNGYNDYTEQEITIITKVLDELS